MTVAVAWSGGLDVQYLSHLSLGAPTRFARLIQSTLPTVLTVQHSKVQYVVAKNF